MLMELLYQSANDRPDGVALICGDEQITHTEIVDRVERLAMGLASHGIGPGDPVALLLPNDPTFVISWHAISALGGIVVPVNPAFKHDELQFCFRECGVRAVITADRSAGMCERIVAGFDEPALVIAATRGNGHSVTLDALMQSEPARLDRRAADEPLVYMFSSGTTGRPKRIARTHGHLRAEADYYAWLGIGPEDTIFCTIPLFHTYGMGCCMIAATRSGATHLMLENPSPFLLGRQRAMELIETQRVTIYPGVPSHFRLMAEAPASADFSSIRLAFSAGAALPQPVFDAFLAKFGVPIRQLYGCTEAGTLTANLEAEPVGSVDCVGRPVGGVEILIEGDEHKPVPPGTVGEITVKSPALTAGYSAMHELNRVAFHNGFFRTGDLGWVDEHGRLTITGRKKRLIDADGYKIDPIEVEDVILAHDQVAEAVVVGVPTELEGEQQIKAVVVPLDALEELEIIDFCRQRLANFKVPKVVEFREEIPKSELGKVLRKYLI